MPTLNLIVQTLHNLARWGLVIFGLIAIIRAYTGWIARKEYQPADNRAAMMFTMIFDIQILLGLILYFSKGWFGVLSSGIGTAAQTGTRFLILEHPFLMLVALVLAHVGRSRSRKAADSLHKFRRAALWFTFSFVLMLAAVPWPFAATARPWLRLFGLTF